MPKTDHRSVYAANPFEEKDRAFLAIGLEVFISHRLALILTYMFFCPLR